MKQTISIFIVEINLDRHIFSCGFNGWFLIISKLVCMIIGNCRIVQSECDSKLDSLTKTSQYKTFFCKAVWNPVYPTAWPGNYFSSFYLLLILLYEAVTVDKLPASLSASPMTNRLFVACCTMTTRGSDLSNRSIKNLPMKTTLHNLW